MEQAVIGHNQEQLKSFDMLASIDMFRFDLQRFGCVLPETRQRVYDEELTYIAEGLNRPLHTEFNLREHGGQLMFFDRGEWRPYMGTLLKGLETAKLEATADSRKQFQVARAENDLLMGYQMQKLAPGQKLHWYSLYPEKEAVQYGEDLVSSLGYQPKRKMGFLYVAEKNLDGSVTLHTQSVDNSSEDAFIAAMLYAGANQNTGIEGLRQAYDSYLGRDGRTYFAGQLTGAELQQENVWESISRHKDLINHYLQELEVLAMSEPGPRGEEERAKKRLTYGVWAALKERMDRQAAGTIHSQHGRYATLKHEIEQAYHTLSNRGEKLFGCGGSIKGEDALLLANSEDVFNAVFGNNSEESVSLPSLIRCINCREKVPSKEVVKPKSWCCPKCKYEVDICDGRVLNPGNKKK